MKFILKKSKLTGSESKYYARPVKMTSRSYEDLIEIVSKPGSILKPTEIHAVIQSYWHTIAGFLAEGEEYKDEFLRVSLSVRGAFDSEEEGFDQKKHKVEVNFIPSKQMNESTRDLCPKNIGHLAVYPHIAELYDWNTDTTNQKLSSGGVVCISGEHLKVYSDDKDQGVFFVEMSSKKKTRIDRIVVNKPKRLEFIMPDLSKGEYRIEVVNTTRHGKALRLSVSNFTLSVV